MARKRALIPKKGMSNACNFQMVQEKKKRANMDSSNNWYQAKSLQVLTELFL